ncbi:MAG: hypothetical protein K0S79_1731 [Nitrospira sp.]|nr:hypothetical protein [Nitrospira sp.]
MAVCVGSGKFVMHVHRRRKGSQCKQDKDQQDRGTALDKTDGRAGKHGGRSQ